MNSSIKIDIKTVKLIMDMLDDYSNAQYFKDDDEYEKVWKILDMLERLVIEEEF